MSDTPIPWLPPGTQVVPPLDVPYNVQRGVLLPDGTWAPLLSPKGYAFYNDYHRYLLAGGSRKSGKTISAVNKAVRHAWEQDGAIIGLVARTMRKVKVGTWRDLCNYVIPGWVAGEFGMEVVKGPITDPTTRMEYLRIRNMHGGISEFQLHSLDVEEDRAIMEKFKNTRFSMLWIIEGDEFTNPMVFNILTDQLRVIKGDFSEQLLIDANPPSEGEEHWLHNLFWKAEHKDSRYYREDWAQMFARHEFGLDDNPFLDARERRELEENYKYDPVKYKRFIKGIWVKDSTAGFFDDVFQPHVHLIGDVSSPDASNWETLTPTTDSPVLICSFDGGDLNQAVTFFTTRKDDEDRTCYDIFDELVSIGEKVMLEDFTAEWVRKIKQWDEWMKKTYKLPAPPRWRFWSDPEVGNYSATTGSNDVAQIYEWSNGLILLNPVTKGRFSVEKRIKMARRLLFEQRLFISAHCKHNEDWVRYLRPPRNRADSKSYIEAGSRYKHAFDASTYGIGAEMPHELIDNTQPPTRVGVITIPTA